MAFFGLTSDYRNALFTQIHEIVFHGKGGYTWQDVFDMPIWLRKFTFLKIKEYYDKEAENNKPKQVTKKQIQRPATNPTYSTKASS